MIRCGNALPRAYMTMRAPERIGGAYIPDQLADFEGHFWPAYSRARLPSPEQANPARCQRITVSGLTITKAFRTSGAIR